MIKPVEHINDVPTRDDAGKVKQASHDWLAGRKVELDDETIKKYRRAYDPDMPVGYRLRQFLSAESEAGRTAKVIKDVFLSFVPWGKQVSNLSELVTDVIEPEQTKEKPMIGKALKRAFTGDGGSFIRLRDEDGSLSLTAILAGIIRAALIVGIFYAANALGLDPAEILSAVFG